VMMDSFRPLKVAKPALEIEDPSYHKSWLQGQHAQFNPPTS
jgi:homogentisate 1,2-dioxygenase